MKKEVPENRAYRGNPLSVSSSAFAEGGWIPDRHSGYGEDRSPELILEGIDPAAVSMAVTLDDADHPLFPNYNHWVAWNLPVVPVIPAGLPRGALVREPICLEQGMAYGKHCYRGPKPPFHWCHEYRFTVYTLDARLDLPASSDKSALLAAMEGHILQSGTLTGKYQRNHKL